MTSKVFGPAVQSQKCVFNRAPRSRQRRHQPSPALRPHHRPARSHTVEWRGRTGAMSFSTKMDVAGQRLAYRRDPIKQTVPHDQPYVVGASKAPDRSTSPSRHRKTATARPEAYDVYLTPLQVTSKAAAAGLAGVAVLSREGQQLSTIASRSKVGELAATQSK